MCLEYRYKKRFSDVPFNVINSPNETRAHKLSLMYLILRMLWITLSTHTYRAFLLLHFHFFRRQYFLETLQQQFSEVVSTFTRTISTQNFPTSLHSTMIQPSAIFDISSLPSLLPNSRQLENEAMVHPRLRREKCFLTWDCVNICSFFQLFYGSFQQIMPLFKCEVRHNVNFYLEVSF